MRIVGRVAWVTARLTGAQGTPETRRVYRTVPLEESAPVVIRTREPGSTGRDHRPLDHRGSGRRTVRSLIILSYQGCERSSHLIPRPTPRFPRLDGRANASSWRSRSRAPFPFYPREVIWRTLTMIPFRAADLIRPDTKNREVAA